jgi:hypothetical protein
MTPWRVFMSKATLTFADEGNFEVSERVGFLPVVDVAMSPAGVSSLDLDKRVSPHSRGGS